MERGLLWLPLLGIFITLTWWGWRSYRQVESYRKWAQAFETAKYDSASVVGLKGMTLTWGQPQADELKALQTVDLDLTEHVDLMVDGQTCPWPPQAMPQGKRFALRLTPSGVEIPYVDADLAIAWCKKLKELVQARSSHKGFDAG